MRLDGIWAIVVVIGGVVVAVTKFALDAMKLQQARLEIRELILRLERLDKDKQESERTVVVPTSEQVERISREHLQYQKQHSHPKALRERGALRSERAWILYTGLASGASVVLIGSWAFMLSGQLDSARSQLQSAQASLMEAENKIDTLTKESSRLQQLLTEADDKIDTLAKESSRLQQLLSEAASLEYATALSSIGSLLNVHDESKMWDAADFNLLTAEAYAQYMGGQYNNARMLALKAKDVDPDKNNGVYDLLVAQTYYRERRYDEAVRSFEAALIRDPTLIAAKANIGSAYYAWAKQETDVSRRQQLLEKSVEVTQQVIAEGSKAAAPFVNLSIALNELGRMEEALDILARYSGPDDGNVFSQRAATLALMGRTSESILALGKAIDIDKGHALRAAMDPDFGSLHADEAFLALLKSALGETAMEETLRSWREQEANDNPR